MHMSIYCLCVDIFRNIFYLCIFFNKFFMDFMQMLGLYDVMDQLAIANSVWWYGCV